MSTWYKLWFNRNLLSQGKAAKDTSQVSLTARISIEAF